LTFYLSDYTPPLQGGGLFGWIPALFSIPDSFVLQHQSLDSYLFLRFLRIAVIICVVGCVITWPVLFPINATGGGTGTQLSVLSINNVANPWKFFAHAGCAWLFFGKSFCCSMSEDEVFSLVAAIVQPPDKTLVNGALSPWPGTMHDRMGGI
jgi:hypothetical protein